MRLAKALFALACVLAIGLTGSIPAPAFADITVVSTLSTQQISPIIPSDPDRTITVYSHGKLARTEIDSGRTVLFSGNDVFVLNNRAKTYYKTSLKSWNGQPQPVLYDVASVAQSDKIDVQSDSDMSKSGDPNASKTFVGLVAQEYDLSGWINVSPTSPDNTQTPGTSGAPRRPGASPTGPSVPDINSAANGYPNAYHPKRGDGSLLHTVQQDSENPADAGKFGLIRSTSISGEVWLSKADPFTSDKSNSVWAQALVSSWGVGPLCGSIASRLSKEHALPVLVQLNFSWVRKPLPTDNDPFAGEQIEVFRHTKVHMSMTVTSVSDAPVDPNLFVIPSDYTQVRAPRHDTTPPPDSDSTDASTLQ